MIQGEAKESLRAGLRQIGFDEVRFAEIDPIFANRAVEWVERGYHADMNWYERSLDKRLDPKRVQNGAQSAILLGVNYWPGEQIAAAETRWGKYALYEDYHDTIEKGLKSAGALLENAYGFEAGDYRYYTDTGPVLERGWAAVSGMGWQGKNGMLISRSFGNWLLLAVVLSRKRIERDPALKKSLRGEGNKIELGAHCGKCRRCIESCPTEAIVESGFIDSNRCISYHTIENKGIIPRWIRPGIGGRIFGCDICLDICPWNRFAKASRQILLNERYSIRNLNLIDILRMDSESFRRAFRRTPVKRLKLRGLLRNACVAAGNLGRESNGWNASVAGGCLVEVRNALFDLAKHEEALVRPHAIWALYRLFGFEVADELRTLMEREQDDQTLEEYRWWQGEMNAET